MGGSPLGFGAPDLGSNDRQLSGLPVEAKIEQNVTGFEFLLCSQQVKPIEFSPYSPQFGQNMVNILCMFKHA